MCGGWKEWCVQVTIHLHVHSIATAKIFKLSTNLISLLVIFFI